MQLTGDLGVLFADATGKAEYSGYKEMLTVADLPGRSMVVYDNERKNEVGIAATVIAPSAGIGDNYKRLHICDDGTVIWQFTNHDLLGTNANFFSFSYFSPWTTSSIMLVMLRHC